MSRTNNDPPGRNPWTPISSSQYANDYSQHQQEFAEENDVDSEFYQQQDYYEDGTPGDQQYEDGEEAFVPYARGFVHRNPTLVRITGHYFRDGFDGTANHPPPPNTQTRGVTTFYKGAENFRLDSASILSVGGNVYGSLDGVAPDPGSSRTGGRTGNRRQFGDSPQNDRIFPPGQGELSLFLDKRRFVDFKATEPPYPIHPRRRDVQQLEEQNQATQPRSYARRPLQSSYSQPGQTGASRIHSPQFHHNSISEHSSEEERDSLYTQPTANPVSSSMRAQDSISRRRDVASSSSQLPQLPQLPRYPSTMTVDVEGASPYLTPAPTIREVTQDSRVTVAYAGTVDDPEQANMPAPFEGEVNAHEESSTKSKAKKKSFKTRVSRLFKSRPKAGQ